MTTIRKSCARLFALTAAFFALSVGTANAEIIEVEFGFADGFQVSVDGGALQASGALTFTGLVDNTTPDLEAQNDRGDFEMISVMLTAPDLGLFDALITLPDPILLRWFSGGLALVDTPDILDIGWNGGPVPAGDRDDLANLAIGTVVATTSTFFLGEITVGGMTIAANIGGGGADGTFAVRAVDVPEPATLLLLSGGLLGLGMMRRRRTA